MNKCYLKISLTADPGDKEYLTDKPMYFVWALGRLDENNDPNFHDIYPKGNLKLHLGKTEPENTCLDWTVNNDKLR